MKIAKPLSDGVFEIKTAEELDDWVRLVEKEVGGLRWAPLGNLPNNVHTVEVASDPALALVEKPTNSIDGLLDLRARERRETAVSPHEAARKWWGVPAGGLSELSDTDRRRLADNIQVIMEESGTTDRPTIVIQDTGTGQHPDDFPATHLSLLGKTKRSSAHMMGVYNAGGAASYKFCSGAIIVSRLSPSLLDGRADEVGVTVVRYNQLDLDKDKVGIYEYAIAKDGSILRLDLDAIPVIGHGTHVKLVEYQLSRYARGAHEPKQSLWHLFHAALPDPALPFRVIENRVDRFAALRGKGPERRVISGLLHLLDRADVAKYSDTREIGLGDDGKITVRYFVINDGRDPDAYTTSDQALTIALNGQRHITRDRYWLKRQLDLFFIWRRLVVIVDATGLSNPAKRQVFASTRESAVDSPLSRTILERVISELRDDENLSALDELEKQKTLAAATKVTSEKVKRQLASQVANLLKGAIAGRKGGRSRPRPTGRRRPAPPRPPVVDDSLLPEVPDSLTIVTDPLRIDRGSTAPLRLEINAKNGFLPKYADRLSVVFGPELKGHVTVASKGKLLGGSVRLTIAADDDAPPETSTVKVALVVPELSVFLTAEGKVEVRIPKKEEENTGRDGGEPDIEIHWIKREGWSEHGFDEESVGDCNPHRDPADRDVILKVEWFLNEAFAPYEQVVSGKRVGETQLKNFSERYAPPIALGLFQQRLAEDAKEQEADERGERIEIPDDYVKGEKSRMARAVLMAMEPEFAMAEAAAE